AGVLRGLGELGRVGDGDSGVAVDVTYYMNGCSGLRRGSFDDVGYDHDVCVSAYPQS
nr:hypothetical protein [Tanacetum cinerariifolium]